MPLELVEVIESTSGNKLNLINAILEPHVKALEARFENLTPIYNLAEKFIKTINQFLTDKKITYSIRGGFRIVLDGEESTEIEPSQLSSGEQQLLLLFCHVLVAQDTPSVFIIDEPEISLNILWQRILFSSLQDLSTEADIQFLFASHSLEIISKHRNRVVSLQKG